MPENPSPQKKLDQWLGFVLNGEEPDPEYRFFEFCFPSAEVLACYVAELSAQDETDVRGVLRVLLLPSTSLGADSLRLYFLQSGGWNGVLGEADFESNKERLDTRFTEYDLRLLRYHANESDEPPPWEGITWVLDLLPARPREALDALSAYVLAHAQTLPDERLTGLEDALAIIRARYVGVPGADVSDRLASLLELSSRDFERLVERVFSANGYETELTPPHAMAGATYWRIGRSRLPSSPYL